MVTVYRGPNWKITVYGREHGIAHFHLEGRDFRCSISIATLDVIIGVAPTAALREACEWAGANRDVLMAKWRELNG
jgi:Domain of unknown function (DUF4160)